MTQHRIAIGLIGSTLVIGMTGSSILSHRAAEGAVDGISPRITVAVLDVGNVLKECKHFKAAMEKMQTEVKEAETRVKNEREKIKSQLEEAQKLPAGSDERLQTEDKLNKIEAAIEATVSVQKKTFLREEANVYYETYRKMSNEVEAYAKANGTEIVIRVNNAPVDISKADSVLAHINRPVLWSAPGTDITSIIIERLNKNGDPSEEDIK